ncbi:hypothetical protein ACEYW6_36355 [Nostoc sp. UIC 10607]|nr:MULTISPECIES: hypothetical protein [Nostoc]
MLLNFGLEAVDHLCCGNMGKVDGYELLRLANNDLPCVLLWE